ncbi:tyrosine-type recombinase/integrase [Chloroflexota bacterium]
MLGKPLTGEGLVFSDAEGKLLLPNSVTYAWINLVRGTGIKPVRLHDVRHSHASLMLKQRKHTKVVQERPGHASIEITLDTYSRVAPGLQAAAAQQFDDTFGVSHNKVAENISSSTYPLDIKQSFRFKRL